MRDARQRLERFRREQRLCELCPKLCHHACPVSNTDRDEALTPWGKNRVAGRIVSAGMPVDAEATELFYACTGCNLCQSACAHGNDVAGSLFAARAVAAEQGCLPEAVEAMLSRWDESCNPFGLDLRPNLSEIPEGRKVGGESNLSLETKRVLVAPGRGLQVLWPGCTTLHEMPDLVATTLSVLDALGEPDFVVYAGPIQCCGYPLLAAGQLERFQRHAREAVRRLRGARRIATPSPECAWVMQVAWPEQAGVEGPEVVPLVELLDLALPRAPAGRPLSFDIVWHDPCYLGRHLGCLEAPRRVGRRIAARPPVDPRPWSGARGYCSGGGGLLPLTRPETTRHIARARVAELTGRSFGPPAEGEVGEAVIATACPAALARFRETGARAYDLVELTAAFLGLSPLPEHHDG